MKKFCSNCGKKIEECECKNKGNNSFVDTCKNICFDILNQVKGILVKPVDTLKENINEDKFVNALVVLGVNCLLVGIISLILAKSLVALVLGGLAELIANDIPYVKIFFTAVITLALTYAAIIGFAYLIMNKIMKDKANLKKITTWFAASSLIMIPALVIVVITSFISTNLTAAVVVASGMLRNYYLFKGLDFTTKIDENKKAYVLACTLLISLFVVGFVVTKVLG